MHASFDPSHFHLLGIVNLALNLSVCPSQSTQNTLPAFQATVSPQAHVSAAPGLEPPPPRSKQSLGPSLLPSPVKPNHSTGPTKVLEPAHQNGIEDGPGDFCPAWKGR